jgi:hypothetical protein
LASSYARGKKAAGRNSAGRDWLIINQGHFVTAKKERCQCLQIAPMIFIAGEIRSLVLLRQKSCVRRYDELNYARDASHAAKVRKYSQRGEAALIYLFFRAKLRRTSKVL